MCITIILHLKNCIKYFWYSRKYRKIVGNFGVTEIPETFPFIARNVPEKGFSKPSRKKRGGGLRFEKLSWEGKALSELVDLKRSLG